MKLAARAFLYHPFASRDAQRVLREQGLWDTMTSDEQLFIASPLLELSERQRVNVSWLMEGATCIMWALGYTATLPPFDTQAELDLLKSIPAEAAMFWDLAIVVTYWFAMAVCGAIAVLGVTPRT